MSKIVYCPTMHSYAEELSERMNFLEFIPVSSAADALYFLNGRHVEAVLIGRVAKQMEIDGEILPYRLKNGNTLVYEKKIVVPYDYLKRLEVKTYLSKNTLQIKDAFKRVAFFHSLEECLDKEGLKVPILINWRDYRDDFELLIPVNDLGKVPYFKAPVLYYVKESLEDDELLRMKSIIAKK